MMRSKVKRSPYSSQLRWAAVKADGTFFQVATGEVLTWRSHHRALLCCDPDERVVRVRVTVEVVE